MQSNQEYWIWTREIQVSNLDIGRNQHRIVWNDERKSSRSLSNVFWLIFNSKVLKLEVVRWFCDFGIENWRNQRRILWNDARKSSRLFLDVACPIFKLNLIFKVLNSQIVHSFWEWELEKSMPSTVKWCTKVKSIFIGVFLTDFELQSTKFGDRLLGYRIWLCSEIFVSKSGKNIAEYYEILIESQAEFNWTPCGRFLSWF